MNLLEQIAIQRGMTTEGFRIQLQEFIRNEANNPFFLAAFGGHTPTPEEFLETFYSSIEKMMDNPEE